MSEKNILMSISHPFIVKLYGSFQDKDRLYLAFEFIRGGEIFRLLRSERMFPNDVTLFYIIFKTSLIASDGHIKITDFGFAKKLVDRTFTLCGTPEYLAPEIIMSMGHNQGVDWWALGIILFEMFVNIIINSYSKSKLSYKRFKYMLAGYPPFYDHNPYEIYKKIAYGHYQFPGHISLCARHLIAGLLERDISRRLGCMSNGATDIKNHPWFNGVVWDKVYRKEIEAPWIPETQEDYFDRYPDSGDINLMPIRDEYQVFFKDF